MVLRFGCASRPAVGPLGPGGWVGPGLTPVRRPTRPPTGSNAGGREVDAIPIVSSDTPARTSSLLATRLAEEWLLATEGAHHLRWKGAPFPRCPHGHCPRRGLRGFAPLRSAHKVPPSWTAAPSGLSASD